MVVEVRIDADVRCTSIPSLSGSLIKPFETCKAIFSDGLNETRPLYELKCGVSKSYRFSSGSVPLNTEPSIFNRSYTTPSVATPNVMCVASCQWCAIGASGRYIAEGRCMNAGGPSAGSPG